MTFAKRVLAVTEEQFNKWDSSRQREYLKKHPTSKFGQNESGKVLKKGTNNKRVPSPNQLNRKDRSTYRDMEDVFERENVEKMSDQDIANLWVRTAIDQDEDEELTREDLKVMKEDALRLAPTLRKHRGDAKNPKKDRW